MEGRTDDLFEAATADDAEQVVGRNSGYQLSEITQAIALPSRRPDTDRTDGRKIGTFCVDAGTSSNLLAGATVVALPSVGHSTTLDEWSACSL